MHECRRQTGAQGKKKVGRARGACGEGACRKANDEKRRGSTRRGRAKGETAQSTDAKDRELGHVGWRQSEGLIYRKARSQQGTEVNVKGEKMAKASTARSTKY